MDNQFALFRTRRFWPMFATMFGGAFNDNLFKSALTVLIAYGLLQTGGINPAVLVSVAAGVFILPFLLFTPYASQLTDAFPKEHVMRMTKIGEIAIVALAGLGFLLQAPLFLLFVLFCLGAQSAFFGPAKFSILPQHLQTQELIAGNALVNTGTYLAILLGTILGAVIAPMSYGLLVVFILLACVAIAGYASARAIPAAPPAEEKPSLRYRPFTDIGQSLRRVWAQPRHVFTAMLGVSWFYFIGGMLLGQFPNYTKFSLGADHLVLTFFMIVFSVGIALGGLLNNRILKGRISARFVPWAALGIAVFTLDLYFASQAFSPVAVQGNPGPLVSLPSFLSIGKSWRIVLDLLALSVCGGLYVVPLRAIVQNSVPADEAARIIGSGVLLDSLFILASSILATALLAAGGTVPDMFLIVVGGSLCACWLLRRLVPQEEALRVPFYLLLNRDIKDKS